MNMLAMGDNFENEGGAFIPWQLDAARITSGIHSSRVGIKERVNHCLSPCFDNARFDNNQNIRVMPMVEFIGMVTKHLTTYSLIVLGNHLHWWGIGVEILIRDSPCQWSPHYRFGEALMPRCGGLDTIQCFHVTEPSLARAEHDKW